jgi:hypothetical protein
MLNRVFSIANCKLLTGPAKADANETANSASVAETNEK